MVDLQVGEGSVDVVCWEENSLGWIPDDDLVICLPGSVEDIQLQPGQLQAQLLGEGLGGADLGEALGLVQPNNVTTLFWKYSKAGQTLD